MCVCVRACMPVRACVCVCVWGHVTDAVRVSLWETDHRGGGEEEALWVPDGVGGPAQLLLQGEGPRQQPDERGHQHTDGG